LSIELRRLRQPISLWDSLLREDEEGRGYWKDYEDHKDEFVPAFLVK
jgi:hypothetical protein